MTLFARRQADNGRRLLGLPLALPLAGPEFRDRLVPRAASQAVSLGAEPAAEVLDLPASAEFYRMTESCPPGCQSGQAAPAVRLVPGVFDTDPAFSPFETATGCSDACGTGLEAPAGGEDGSRAGRPSSPPGTGGEVARRSRDGEGGACNSVALSDASAFILRLICAHEGRGESDILAGLIAAAGEAIGLSPLLLAGAGDIEDLAGLPDYARRAASRFRGSALTARDRAPPEVRRAGQPPQGGGTAVSEKDSGGP